MSDLTRPGALRSLVLIATAGSIAWAIGRALPPSYSQLLLMLMVLLAVLEAEASWQLTSQRDMTRPQIRTMRISEIVMAFAAVKFFQLVLSLIGGSAGPSPFTRAIFDSEAVVVWLICIGTWIFAAGTISDLERLGSPSEPAPNYRPPLPSLTGRFLVGGVVIVAAGALALVDLAVLPDPARGPSFAWFWPATLYFLVVLLVLGTIRQQETQLQWRRQNMTVAPEVATRWWAGVGTIVGLAVLAMVAIPVVRGGRALGFAYDRMVVFVAWLAGGLGITIRLEERSTQAVPPTPAEEAVTAAQAGGSGFVSGVADVVTGFLFLLFMVALAFAALRLLRGLGLPMGSLGGRGLASGIWRALWLAVSAIPRLLVWAAQALIAWLRRVWAGDEEPIEPEGAGDGPTGRQAPVWGAGDENRQQIAELYRRFLHSAGRRFVFRRRSETPREYGRNVGRRTKEPKPVDDLTAGFNEARYSRHPIVSEDVAQVGDALEAFEAGLEATEDGSIADAEP